MSGSIFQDDIRKASTLIKNLCKEGAVDKEGWDFLLTLIFGLYGGCAVGLILLTVSTESVSEISASISIFSPIFFLLFLLKSFRDYLVKENKWRTSGAVVLIVFAFFMLGVVGVGYIDFANALTSGKEVRLAAGTIEKLEPRRRGAPRVYIFDGQSTIPNIPITDEEYATLRPGDYYVSNMRLGGLGYYYRWRIDSWNRSWEEEGMHHKDKDLK